MVNLHEYQTKELFLDAGLPVPFGIVVNNATAALKAYKELKEEKLVVKAQIHAGARGKAGGIKVINSKDELVAAIDSMIGKNLITPQTDEQGLPVERVLLEYSCNIVKEFYLSAIVDRSTASIMVIASSEGGMNIEETANNHPDKIIKIAIDSQTGVTDVDISGLADVFGLTEQHNQLQHIVEKMVELLLKYDLTLVEINPLVLDDNGNLQCLDGKVNVDDNALYRQADIAAMEDSSQESRLINLAKRHALNYIPLDGNIGCLVNGAGLAMATMDLIKLYGASPANFLDIGGDATTERIHQAISMTYAKGKAKGILINIFGGIVRCDMVAAAIIEFKDADTSGTPIVARFVGNKADIARESIHGYSKDITVVDDLATAVETIIEKVRSRI